VRYDAKDNDFLFPGAARSGAVCRGTFNKAWNKGVQDVLGLRGLTPHVMRHAGATIYLARYPGRYSEVADPLGDKERTTRAFYARGAGREAAALFAGVLVELDPSLNEFIIGGY
jgi:integrase